MKDTKIKFMFITLLALTLLSIFTNTPVYASKLDKTKEQKNALEQRKLEINSKISDLEKEKGDILGFIKKLDKELNDIAGKINDLQGQIEEAEEKLKLTQGELELSRQKETEQYTAMSMRIKYIYENGSSSFFDILFGSKSLEDFLNQIEIRAKIAEYDKKVLDEYKLISKEVSEKEKEAELALSNLNSLKEQFEYEQDAVEILVQNKNKELAKFNEDILESKLEVKELEKNIEKTKKEIEKLEEEERRKAEEELRRLQEEKQRKEEERKRREEEDRKRKEEEARKKAENSNKTNYTKLEGVVYATTGVNVRTEPNTTSIRIGMLYEGQKVDRLGVTSNGWVVVKVNGATGYVLSDYISESKPEVELGNNNQGNNNNNSSGYTWPTPTSKRVTSNYGWRVHPVHGTKKHHNGIDIGAPFGAPIVAVASGKITKATYGVVNGNYIYLDHGNGLVSKYLHCSSLAVSAGQHVEKGQVIAYVGSTGTSTGNHLHFQIEKNGQHVDPFNYVSK